MLFLCKEKERLCQVFVGTFFVFRNSLEKLCDSWALPFVECVAVWAPKLPVLHTDVLKPTSHKVFLRNYWKPKEPATNNRHKSIISNSVSASCWPNSKKLHLQPPIFQFLYDLFSFFSYLGQPFQFICWLKLTLSQKQSFIFIIFMTYLIKTLFTVNAYP